MGDSFDKYYMPLVEVKDFSALTDKPFFDQPQKINKKHMRNLLQYKEKFIYLYIN